MRLRKPLFKASACSFNKLTALGMPASANIFKPLPATCGLGSAMAATTRLTPASIKPNAQGGVRP